MYLLIVFTLDVYRVAPETAVVVRIVYWWVSPLGATPKEAAWLDEEGGSIRENVGANKVRRVHTVFLN